MENAARNQPVPGETDPAGGLVECGVSEPVAEAVLEPRVAPRFTLLIRAAKLVTSHGEFVCVIRDVSQIGLSIRLFHAMPTGEPIELHMPGGNSYELQKIWERANEAGFEFAQQIDVAQFVNEAGAFPKRGLRLGLCFPVKVSTLTQSCEAFIENLSQQGARFSCDQILAIDQSVRLECLESDIGFGEVRAKVRWRRDSEYGVVFDDTLTLADFAKLAARLQSPKLLG